MRLSRDEIRELESREEKETGRSLARAEDAKRRAAREVEERYNEIMGQIQKLRDEKHEVLKTPPTKDELLAVAKKALKAERQHMMDLYLKKHLEDCQRNAGKPFRSEVIRYTFGGDNAHRLVPFIFSEEDIEQAVSRIRGRVLSHSLRSPGLLTTGRGRNHNL